MSTSLRSLVLCSLLLLTACNDDGSNPASGNTPGTTPTDTTGPTTPGPGTPVATEPDYWPTTDWQTAAPEAHGVPAGAFDTLAADAATSLPYYTSLLVIKDGYIVHESYHPVLSNPANPASSVVEPSIVSTKHNLWSVTKSVTSMTVGSAWTQGDIISSDLDSTVDSLPAAVLPGIAAGDERRGISMRHALQMRSGLGWNETAWLLLPGKSPLLSSPPAGCPSGGESMLCAILQFPVATGWTPGTVWNYNTYDSYLVSAFFTQKTGQTLADYARTNLFTPLGITDFTPGTDWLKYGNYTFGGGFLSLRSRDLAKLGLLMQYKGKWDGSQLLAKEWLDLSLAPQGAGKKSVFGPTGEPNGSTNLDISYYGMQWWLKTAANQNADIAGEDAISAHGLGGQYMHVFRDKGLIIVITCETVTSGALTEGRGPAIEAFLKTRILDKLP